MYLFYKRYGLFTFGFLLLAFHFSFVTSHFSLLISHFFPPPLFTLIYYLFTLQSNLLFNHQFSQVNQAISHTAQSCVDTAIGDLCNFFKTKIGIVT